VFTGLLTIIWPLVGLGTVEQSFEAAVLVGASVLVRDFYLSKFGKLKRYVLCPVVDMFNHRSSSTADASVNYFTGNFEVLTGSEEAYREGDQVYITYGKQGNDRLLQYYGFVETDNPNDSYDFCGSFLEVFQRLGGAMQERVGQLPQEPSTKERLGQLERVLQESGVAGLVVGTIGDEARRVADARDVSTEDVKAIDTDVRFFKRSGWDDVTLRCVRAMCSSASEWKGLCDGGGQLKNLDVLGNPPSSDTERKGLEVLKALAKCELDTLPTTLQADMQELASIRAGGPGAGSTRGFGASTETAKKPQSETAEVVDPSGKYSEQIFSALAFRIEKKKLLQLASKWEPQW